MLSLPMSTLCCKWHKALDHKSLGERFKSLKVFDWQVEDKTMKTVISRICNMILTVSTKYRRLCAGLTRQIDLLRQVQNPFCVFYFRLFFIKQHRGPRNSLNAWYSADVQSVSTWPFFQSVFSPTLLHEGYNFTRSYKTDTPLSPTVWTLTLPEL